MRARAGVPFDEFLLGHDLQQLEDGGVTDRLLSFSAQGVMHFAHGAPAATPQDGEDLQLRIGRAAHGAMIYEGLRIVNTKPFVMMHIGRMNPAIQSRLDQIAASKAEGQAVAAGLSDEQLNWHPARDSWSIAECL